MGKSGFWVQKLLKPHMSQFSPSSRQNWRVNCSTSRNYRNAHCWAEYIYHLMFVSHVETKGYFCDFVNPPCSCRPVLSNKLVMVKFTQYCFVNVLKILLTPPHYPFIFCCVFSIFCFQSTLWLAYLLPLWLHMRWYGAHALLHEPINFIMDIHIGCPYLTFDFLVTVAGLVGQAAFK